MTKTILYIATSLDGYIADAQHKLDWLTSFDGQGEDFNYSSFYARIGAVIMGSTTFEDVLQLSPQQYPYADVRSYVVTRRSISVPSGHDIHLWSSDFADLLRDARAYSAAKERDIWLVGGGKLASAFFANGWIDEIILTIMPVMLGAGIPLFHSGQAHLSHWRLDKVEHWHTGVVQMHYSKA